MENLAFEPEVCIGSKIKKLGRVIGRIYGGPYREFGVTLSQVNILFVIFKYPGVHQSEVGKQLQLERSTLSRDIKLLKKKKLIYLKNVQGTRTSSLFLTKVGTLKVKLIIPVWKEVQSRVESALKGADVSMIDRVTNNLLKLDI